MLEEFFENKPVDKREFINFGVKHNIPVMDLLRNTTNLVDFLATIIELRFGIFFGTFFSKLKYEEKAFPNSKLTPDWIICTGGQNLVAEVLRLNPSKTDQEEIEFGDELIHTLGQIQQNYYIQLEFEYSDILKKSVEFDQLFISVSEWLQKTRNIGDKIILFDINFEVVGKDRGKGNVLSIGNFTKINFDYRRLTGKNSRLLSKLKYAEFAYKNNMPFIICMYLSFESWFTPEDIYEHLYGMSGNFYHHEPLGEYYPNAPFHDISKGLFYSNEVFRTWVSGVLIRYNKDFIFFPNFSNTNILSDKVYNILAPYIYKELT